MADEIAGYDIAAITQETPFVDDLAQVSGYPTFGTPCEMGDAIVDAGFDVVVGATNHSLDKGLYGLNTTLSFWEDSHPETTLLGLHSSPDKANSVSYIEKNGFTIAMSDYTYGLNGLILPSGSKYMVDLRDDLDQICTNLAEAEDKCDLTVAFAHMGEEYSTTPTPDQRLAATMMADAGADVIIMSHAHVVQPCEELMTEQGNKALVYYGLGNFVSNQMDISNMLGGAAELVFEKALQPDGTYKTAVASNEFIPLFCHWNSSTSTMYFLDDYTDELAASHAISGVTTAKARQPWTDSTGE